MGMTSAPDLSVRLGPLSLKNPVITASGTFGYGLEFEDYMDLNAPGAIVVKGLSAEPSPGNPPPRIAETSSGMLNAIGLENIGVRAFVDDYLPKLRGYDTAVIANIYGKRIEDYEKVLDVLNGSEGLSAVEINISCPNVREGGMLFGQDPEQAERLTARAVERSRYPVIVKLTPNVTDIKVIARAVENGGAHIISLINTLGGMAVDIETRKPRLANVFGGLSGPAIKPVALKMVYEAAGAVNIPVIGLGGISTVEDVLEFLIAGASAVQVGTMNFRNPAASETLVLRLGEYMERHGIERAGDITGSLTT